jgi:hypothetical protein
MPSAQVEYRVRAALALTRSECEDPSLALKRPAEASKAQEWRAELLDQVDASSISQLPTHWKNRLHVRRAAVWSGLAFDRLRIAQNRIGSQQAAQKALDELARVNKAELTEDDQAAMNDAVMRVNASRWAAVDGVPAAGPQDLRVATEAGTEPGHTCVVLTQASRALAKRCTYGIVWPASLSVNREGNAASLAVQPQAGWREMWLFRKLPDGWSVDVVVPAAVNPELGYAEFAGWVPGGQQMLVAREARGEGKYKRSYEVLDLITLSTQRQSSDPSILGAFQRWPNPQWLRQTVSLR